MATGGGCIYNLYILLPLSLLQLWREIAGLEGPDPESRVVLANGFRVIGILAAAALLEQRWSCARKHTHTHVVHRSCSGGSPRRAATGRPLAERCNARAATSALPDRRCRARHRCRLSASGRRADAHSRCAGAGSDGCGGGLRSASHRECPAGYWSGRSSSGCSSSGRC